MLFGRRDRHHILRRILIVEDEPLVAFDNEHFLREAGFEIVATVDGVADAIRIIQHEAIDLVLADVRLSGGGNGIDVAHAAHEKEMPVLFVTGACPIEARALAVGCLAKPYSARDLKAAIEAVEAMLSGQPVKKKPRALTLFG
ncbi:response regulator [Sphingomonas oleivorans]|uniref:Response regulator n=1 Tax=Sphingomonas oleivorans TaxID=1735121 RepID=A0A2T5FV44_9SPHN|nr:response regulator [Sphingomonas oleivorans]PTQ08611.1 response regulator [Sphingomonas oleivorans]